METFMPFFTVLRLLLAGVLLTAAVGKLLHRQAFRHTLAQFGVPLRWQASLAWFMPACELVIASMLTLAAGAWWGALASAILLGIYTSALGYQLQRGRRPSCNCLGQQAATPIGPATVLRNGVLLLMATGLIYAGPAYPHAAMWPYLANAPALAMCLAVVALQWWLLHHVLQQNGRLILRMDSMELRLDAANIQPLHAADLQPRGLAVGRFAPEFTLPETGSGNSVSLAQLRASDRPVLLIFSDIACSPCMEMAPSIDNWHRQFLGRISIAVILRAEAGHLSRPRAVTTLLAEDRHVAASYDALVTPSAVMVSAEGTIASHLALGSKEIYDLLQSSTPHLHDDSEIAA
jgi:hypothetical protein